MSAVMVQDHHGSYEVHIGRPPLLGNSPPGVVLDESFQKSGSSKTRGSLCKFRYDITPKFLETAGYGCREIKGQRSQETSAAFNYRRRLC